MILWPGLEADASADAWSLRTGQSGGGLVTNTGAFHGARILVVEDEPQVQDFISRVLQLEGATVVTASTGLEALERMQDAGPFRVVTLDLCLPDISGWDVLDAIRLIDASPAACPVVVLSARPDDEIVRRSAALGAAYMVKPISARALVERLGAFIEGLPWSGE